MTTTAPESTIVQHNGHVIRSEVQQDVLRVLTQMAYFGATSAEVEKILDLDHGKVSGALSVLHKKEILALLQEKRNGFFVYVMADKVDNRVEKERVTMHCSGCRCHSDD